MHRIKSFFVNTFIGGLVVLLPVLIFAFLINWIVSFFGDLLEPLVALFPIAINHTFAKIMAFLVVLGFCFTVGLFIRTNFGKNIFSYIENALLKKLPFYSTIKETIAQFLGADKMPFKEVVMVKPYGGNAKMLGFVTAKFDDGTYTIFVPTAPNPTSGFVIFLKEEFLEHLDITVEEAMRTNIGLGRGAETVIKFEVEK